MENRLQCCHSKMTMPRTEQGGVKFCFSQMLQHLTWCSIDKIPNPSCNQFSIQSFKREQKVLQFMVEVLVKDWNLKNFDILGGHIQFSILSTLEPLFPLSRIRSRFICHSAEWCIVLQEPLNSPAETTWRLGQKWQQNDEQQLRFGRAPYLKLITYLVLQLNCRFNVQNSPISVKKIFIGKGLINFSSKLKWKW